MFYNRIFFVFVFVFFTLPLLAVWPETDRGTTAPARTPLRTSAEVVVAQRRTYPQPVQYFQEYPGHTSPIRPITPSEELINNLLTHQAQARNAGG